MLRVTWWLEPARGAWGKEYVIGLILEGGIVLENYQNEVALMILARFGGWWTPRGLVEPEFG